MKRMRDIALAGIVVLNVIATMVAFGESYAGLYRWAFEHGVEGFWAAIWPMMVDLIILVAEFGLFVAHYDKWLARHKAWLWFVMLTALSVSTGGNTGHVHSTDWLSRLTAALPPVALMFTTTVGFGVMKRVFGARQSGPSESRTGTSNIPAGYPLSEMASAASQTTLKIGDSQESTGPQQLRERYHVGNNVWAADPNLQSSFEQMKDGPETAGTAGPDAEPDLSESLLDMGFKVIPGKSFSMPRDPREGLSLKQRRVRDMYDVDPDISVNSIAERLGIAWATAKKYLEETKEARGV
jgi:hypothetical protein